MFGCNHTMMLEIILPGFSGVSYLYAEGKGFRSCFFLSGVGPWMLEDTGKATAVFTVVDFLPVLDRMLDLGSLGTRDIPRASYLWMF